MGVSFDKIDGVIWYDGRLVPWTDANVHILTHGLQGAQGGPLHFQGLDGGLEHLHIERQPAFHGFQVGNLLVQVFQ